jgi:Mannosyltransferase (PIG-V)
VTAARGAPVRATPERRWLPIDARIVGVAIGFRAVSALVAFFVSITFPLNANPGFSVYRTPHAFWDTFARYDAGWYNQIATGGYAYAAGGRNNLAFFPLYPLLMRWGGKLLGGEQQDFYFAGIIVSWVAFAIAMPLLYRLARLDLPHEAALRAVAYAAVFPSAYFFGVVYSESLFYLGLVGAVLALRTRHWVWAAIAGSVMTATRVNGIMFVPALALIAWQLDTSRSVRIKAALAVLGASGGFLAYCLYNYWISGDPIAWYHAITHWGYHPGGNPVGGLFAIGQALTTRFYQYLATENMAPYDTLNAVLAAAVLLSVPLIWHRFGFGFASVLVLGLILPLSSGQFEGLGRYCSVLFPVPILLASLQGETRHLGLIAGSAMLYALGLALFVNLHPLF